MKRFLYKLLAVVIIVGAGFIAFAYYANFASGERVGNVVKLMKKGIIFKTWEGTLDMGIYQGATPNKGSVANTIWEFSVPSEAVAKKIQQANETGNRVSLQYEEKFFRFFWIGYTKYWVTDVRVIPKNDPTPPPMSNPGTPPTQL
jgi:hypothetical protein